MKLVVLGLSITSSWGNGHATTYRGLLRALARRGHRAIFFEWDAPWYGGAHRDLPPDDCGCADIRLYREWRDAIPGLRRELRDADAALLGSYFPDGIAAAELLGEEYDGTRLFYDIDTPITLRAFREDGRAAYLRADQVPIFHAYLSFTGGPALAELEGCYGSPRAVAFYCSVDPEEHRPRPVRHEYRCALGYMGTYAADRQAGLERLLLEPARRRLQEPFIVSGPQYPDSVDWPSNVFRFEHLPPEEHPAFYSSNRLTLNLTRSEMRLRGWSPSVRIFEAAACGTAIVSDVWEGLGTLLEPGKEILLADDTSDVLDYLDLSDAEARAIGEAARERILLQHTNRARAKQFEEIAGTSALSGAPPG